MIIALIALWFFVSNTVVYNYSFSRLLFVSGLERRMPAALGRVDDRTRVPRVAIIAQTVMASLFEPGLGYDAEVIPSWRHIIDLSDIEASVGTHTVGQSGHPASSHFRDFVELWSKGEYHPLPFARDKVDAVAESTLKLTPR